MISLRTLPVQLKNLTPIQLRYYNDEDHRFLIVSAGRRSRKTLIGKRKLLNRALKHPDQRLFHGAPTRDQAKSIFWDTLKRETTHVQAKAPNESKLYITLKNNTEIHVIGLDKPQRVEGQPWNGCHITEFADVKSKAWSENIRPVLADTLGWAILDGVPEMTNPHYREMARNACGGSVPPTVPKEGAYGENNDWAFYSWFSSDVLLKSELDAIKADTDEKVFKQEYEGSFESLEGQVYYAYNADYYPHGNLDESIKYDPNLPVYMGFDFNVNPMTAFLSHFKRAQDGPNKGKIEIHVFKSYFLPNSNTKELAERIITEHPETSTFYLTPCQSSTARQTVADKGVTDLKIIRNTFAECGKMLYIKKKSKNPAVKQKTYSVNGLLSHNRVRINPREKGNKYLIKDFEGLAYKEGTSDFDHTDKMLGHISDAFGYVAEYYFPIKNKVQNNTDLGIVI